MAEIRKFDGNSSEGIQKLVREALGENVRPVHPSELNARTGSPVEPVDATLQQDQLNQQIKLGYLFYGPGE